MMGGCMKRSGRVVVILLALPWFGCALAHGVDTGTETAGITQSDLACASDPVDDLDGLHQHLECEGLYSNIRDKTLAKGVEPYKPGVVLWSDGAEKQRWISLPKGKKIDTSTPIEWS